VELDQLNHGGLVVFVQLSGNMVAHHAEVFWAKPEVAAGPKEIVIYCDGSDPQVFPWKEEFTPNLGNIGLNGRLETTARRIVIRYEDGSRYVLKDRNGQTGYVRVEKES
jgi:hypothetical protein